jgi:hypothetical protein
MQLGQFRPVQRVCAKAGGKVMTDRIHSLTIVLERDIRIDDAQATIAAIGQIKGVLSVTPNVASIEDHIAFERARRELADKIWAVVFRDGIWSRDT